MALDERPARPEKQDLVARTRQRARRGHEADRRAARHEDVRARDGNPGVGRGPRRDRVAKLREPPDVRVPVDPGDSRRQFLGPTARGRRPKRIADVEREDLAPVRRHLPEKARVRAAAQCGDGGRRSRRAGHGAMLAPGRVSGLSFRPGVRHRRPHGRPLRPPRVSPPHRARHPAARDGRGSRRAPPCARGLDPVREPRHPSRAADPARPSLARGQARRGPPGRLLLRAEHALFGRADRARLSRHAARGARAPRRPHGQPAHAHASLRSRGRPRLALRRRLRRRRAVGAPPARAGGRDRGRAAGGSASSRTARERVLQSIGPDGWRDLYAFTLEPQLPSTTSSRTTTRRRTPTRRSRRSRRPADVGGPAPSSCAAPFSRPSGPARRRSRRPRPRATRFSTSSAGASASTFPQARASGRRSRRRDPLGRSGRTGAPEAIRTPGLQIRSLTLYPAELRAHARCFEELG